MLLAQSCPTLCNPMDSPRNSLGQNTGVGSLSLLQGIFPTQRSNPGLPHCRRILYQLSHKGSPRILEWVAYPFSRGSSWPRNQTGVSCIAGRFFTNWALTSIKSLPPSTKKNCLKVFCKLLGHNINIRESALKHKCYQSPRNERQVKQFPKVSVHPMRQW